MMSATFPLLDQLDICESRHRGSPESVAAHEKVINQKRESYERIMKIYRARRAYGATSHEISGATGMPLQTVSARLSELRHVLGWLKKSGERRNGAAVLIET